MTVIRTAALCSALLSFPAAALASTIDPIDLTSDGSDVIDPKLYEIAANTSAPVISLQAILGHWLKITGNNTYIDLGTGMPNTTQFGSQYWNFQNIVNDTGHFVSDLELDMFATFNGGHPTQTTVFTCGFTSPTAPVHFLNCTVSPGSVYGQQTIVAEWTLTGGGAKPGLAPGDHFQLSLQDTGITAPGDFRISSTPEPATLWLAGGGALAFALWRRRNRS